MSVCVLTVTCAKMDDLTEIFFRMQTCTGPRRKLMAKSLDCTSGSMCVCHSLCDIGVLCMVKVSDQVSFLYDGYHNG